MRPVHVGDATAQLLDHVRRADADWAPRLSGHLTANAKELATELKAFMCRLDGDEYANLMLASREVATHYKWLVAAGDRQEWKVWLHQYKDDLSPSGVYADVPHNHRYNFVSLILNGTYENLGYTVHGEEELQLVSQRGVGRGDVIALDHREVHSLTQIGPGTVSLFIQGRIRKESSVSYRPDGTPKPHESLERVLDRLRDTLAG
jgi:predicted metal-dependent enzyme (double-stranded beta helix superfamily)